jgi:hypothetical protein
MIDSDMINATVSFAAFSESCGLDVLIAMWTVAQAVTLLNDACERCVFQLLIMAKHMSIAEA